MLKSFALAILGSAVLAPAQADQHATQHTAHQAPIAIAQPAPFVLMDSRPEAWRLSRGTQAADWRILDAQGQRIPFALWPQESEPASEAQWRALALFSLPPIKKPKQREQQAEQPAGVVLDLGTAPASAKLAERLRLDWPESSPPFQIGYRLQTGTDLQHWQELGTGQLLHLLGPEGGRLQQRELTLPATPQRYLRLLWDGPGGPALQAAHLLERALPSATAPSLATLQAPLPAADAQGALLIDLGGPQQLRSFRLRANSGTWVLPMQLQARSHPHGPWQTLAHPVLFRVQRGATADESPPLQLDLSAVQLRLLPPPGAALPAPGSVRAEWQVVLPRLVWATQGQAPYRLEVNSAARDAGPLPLPQVLPDAWREREQERLGQAELGAFQPVILPAAPGPSPAQRQALLWSVLGLGVAGLAWAAWRLLRLGPTDSQSREDQAH